MIILVIIRLKKPVGVVIDDLKSNDRVTDVGVVTSTYVERLDVMQGPFPCREIGLSTSAEDAFDCVNVVADHCLADIVVGSCLSHLHVCSPAVSSKQ